MKKLFVCLFLTALLFSCLPGTAEISSIFPLAEPVTLELVVCTASDVSELEDCLYYQQLVKDTNVHLKLISLGSDQVDDTVRSKLNLMLSSGEYGEGIWGGSLLAEADLVALAEAGILLPMNEYIDDPEIMPNFNKRVLSESPKTKAFITAQDGNIYALPGFNNAIGNYLESPININKVWLERLNLEVPTTMAEFKDVLIAFRDGDPNQNGIKDEIPYILLTSDPFRHVEALLGCWGLATKDNALDNFVMVQDGKVVFVPIQEGYKAALTELNSWWEEGLIWSEAFTGNAETFNAVLNSDPVRVGAMSMRAIATENSEYMLMLPPKVEGYTQKWYYHPGFQGIKGKFSMTSKAQHPEVLMAYMDIFYSRAGHLGLYYGLESEGRYSYDDEGFMYDTRTELSEAEKLKFEDGLGPIMTKFVRDPQFVVTAADYQTDARTNEVETKAYEMYQQIINKEIWPRPFFTADDSIRLGELRTDIFNTVTEMRAKWITGQSDINSDWGDYIKQLNSMGLEEMIALLQKAYDQYLTGM